MVAEAGGSGIGLSLMASASSRDAPLCPRGWKRGPPGLGPPPLGGERLGRERWVGEAAAEPVPLCRRCPRRCLCGRARRGLPLKARCGPRGGLPRARHPPPVSPRVPCHALTRPAGRDREGQRGGHCGTNESVWGNTWHVGTRRDTGGISGGQRRARTWRGHLAGQLRCKVHLEGYCVGTRKDTGGNIGDTGKTGTGMSGILRATSRGAEGHLGRTQGVREGHLGETQRDTLDKYQGMRKDAVEDIKGARRDTRQDTGDGSKEKRGSTGHKSAQQQ